MSHDQQAPMDVRGFLSVLRRRKLILFVCVIVLPAAAVALSLTQPKKYTASASLLFRNTELDERVFGSQVFTPSEDPAREAATNAELISLRAVARRTARTLGGGVTTGEVSSRVKTAPVGDSDVITVKATDRSRRFAARLANTFAREYIAFRQEADRAKLREAQALVDRQISALPTGGQNTEEARSLRERRDQLQVLTALQTGNAELVEPAAIPSSPSSPRPVRNGIIALIVGLLAGIGLALVRDRMDRRLRGTRDAEDVLGIPLLGTVPRSRQLARRATVDGVARGVSAEKWAFQMLRANLRYFAIDDRPLGSIAVTSALAQEGKSTVAWHLAMAAAAPGTDVLLIEADMRHPGLKTFLPATLESAEAGNGRRAQPGLSEFLAGTADIDDIIQVIEPTPGDRGFPAAPVDVIVGGGAPPNPAQLSETERMKWLLREAERQYDLVLVDTPPLLVVPDPVPIVQAVAGVVVVVRIGQSTWHSATRLNERMAHLGISPLGAVVNYVKPADDEETSYGYAYGRQAAEQVR
jgi:succinoglycan biosynthesis transport protein ExoP